MSWFGKTEQEPSLLPTHNQTSLFAGAGATNHNAPAPNPNANSSGAARTYTPGQAGSQVGSQGNAASSTTNVNGDKYPGLTEYHLGHGKRLAEEGQ